MENGFYEGQTVTFVCDDGYLLVGSETRTCTSGGQWTGTTASCESKHFICIDCDINISSKSINLPINYVVPAVETE